MRKHFLLFSVACITLCVSVLHSQVKPSEPGMSALSGEESKMIDSVINQITKGLAFGRILEKDGINLTLSYSGVTPFARNGIEYEVFPSLGFFRIRRFVSGDELDWLYIKWLGKGSPVVVHKVEDRSNCELKDEAKRVILAVGSGLSETDLQNAIITCTRSNNDYIHVSRKISQNQGQVVLVEILAKRSDGNLEVESVSLDKLWRSP